MISTEEYIQLKAFARHDGLFIGLLWIFTLGCFAGSMWSPEVEIGFIAGVMTSPFLIYFRLRDFRNKALGGFISYRRAVAYCLMTTTCASILLAAATLVYFYFIDDGMLMNTLYRNISVPEIREGFKQMQIDPDLLEAQIAEIGKLRPIDFAFSIFFNSVVSSAVLSLLLGLIGMRNKR